jgi:hypothetical protein
MVKLATLPKTYVSGGGLVQLTTVYLLRGMVKLATLPKLT